MALDSAQSAGIVNPDGARCVVAGPGSGKTTTMVALIQSLIQSGTPASDIRAITFSKEMATTLQTRLKIKGVASTFHSLGYEICSSQDRKPVEPEIRHRLVFGLTKRWRLDYKELDNFIGAMKRAGVSPEAAQETDNYHYGLVSAYTQYETERLKGGWIDFDSMILDAVNLLEKPEFRARWQYKYLIVDEAQDTDNLQWRMMRLMSERYGNITVVGDPNQAIYAFRGAVPENLTKFESWFPGGRKLYLGRNYRSTKAIVKFVRENAPKGTPRELLDGMIAAREEQGAPIGLRMYWKDEVEAESALKLSQSDPLNSVILVRTNRWAGVLERLCNRHGIRYCLLGHTGFWKRAEIGKVIKAMQNYPKLRTQQALNLVLPDIERKYAVDDRTERDNDALENLGSLRVIANDYEMSCDFFTYANKMMHRRNDPRGVSISTVHQAKGGEWKNVYVLGVNGKGFPHPKGDPEEEARIYFVAISRAIDFLRLSFSGTPSPYLRKYLTEEILDKLREKADEVDRLQGQHKLFS